MAGRPIKAETKCPPMMLLGYANAALGSANSKTHVAPNGAIIDGTRPNKSPQAKLKSQTSHQRSLTLPIKNQI